MRAFDKVIVAFILVAFLVLVPTQAQSEFVDDSFAWLDDKAETDWGTTTETVAFTLLGLSDYSLQSKLDLGVVELIALSKDGLGVCWSATGTGTCKIKDTSIAIIALREVGEDVTAPVAWLQEQKVDYKAAGDNWFTQFEILAGDNAGTCTVEYNQNGEKRDTVTIESDRKVSVASSSTCFETATAPLDYWLKIKPACLQKTNPTDEIRFYVSCEETSWISNLLFISDSSPRVFWPYPSISSPDWLEFSSKCFPDSEASDTCEYVATLWAGYALSFVGEESNTIAYLEENAPQFSPLSYLLLHLTTSDPAFAQTLEGRINDKQSIFGSWRLSLGQTSEFVTAFGYLSSLTSGVADAANAKSWFENKLTEVSPFWNGQKDTGAILWAVFSTGSGPPNPQVEFDFNIEIVPPQSPTIIEQGDEVGYEVVISLLSGNIGENRVDLTAAFDTALGTHLFRNSTGSSTIFLGVAPQTATLKIYTQSATPNDTYIINVTGTTPDGTLIRTDTVELKVILEEGSTTQQCQSFVGYTCCSLSDVIQGSTENPAGSCSFSTLTDPVCVEEVSCLDTNDDICGYPIGRCCIDAASSATTYPYLDNTCAVGESCASSCEQDGPIPIQKCSDVPGTGICCDAGLASGTRYDRKDCSIGEICATGCLTTQTTDDCYGVGGICCSEVDSSLSRSGYSGYDDTCGFNQVCASQCADSEGSGSGGTGGGGLGTFFLWFLIIILLAAIGVGIWWYLKNKKGKKEQKIPGLDRLRLGGSAAPGAIPSFKRPGTPPGPPLRRPLPGARGRPRPMMRARPGYQIRPMPVRAPVRRSAAPLFAPIKARPVKRKSSKKKSTVASRKKTETALEKTLKDLAKIQKSKLKRVSKKKKK